MQFGKKRITPLALALTLSVGATAVVVAQPATASSDVQKYAEEANQARNALDRAKAEARKSEKARDKAITKKASADAGVYKTVAAVDKVRSDVKSARTVLSDIDQKVRQAREDAEAAQRGEGLLDVAGTATAVAAGDTDSGAVAAVVGVVKAGLTGLVGPVTSVLDPINDAVHDRLEEADRSFAEARRHEQTLEVQRAAALEFHASSASELARVEQAKAEAKAAHRAAVRAEKKAAEQHKGDEEAQEKAAAAVKKAEAALDEAKSKARQAQEKAEAEAEAKKAAEREAAEKEAAEREAAVQAASRSADTSETVRPGTGQTTSPYGMRTHPITGVHKLHSGTDFGYGDGQAYAAKSGTVSAVTYDGGYGNMVTIDHGGGIQTRYAHLAEPTVSVGEKVSAGSVVGRIGSTGYSTGPHLHFEVLENGDFRDPMGWLD